MPERSEARKSREEESANKRKQDGQMNSGVFPGVLVRETAGEQGERRTALMSCIPHLHLL